MATEQGQKAAFSEPRTDNCTKMPIEVVITLSQPSMYENSAAQEMSKPLSELFFGPCQLLTGVPIENLHNDQKRMNILINNFHSINFLEICAHAYKFNNLICN